MTQICKGIRRCHEHSEAFPAQAGELGGAFMVAPCCTEFGRARETSNHTRIAGKGC